jgi:hypothetical protein
METRVALFQLAARHGLDGPETARLLALAGLDDEPAGLTRGLARATAVLAAVLLGLGLVFWVAANWALLGRWGQFVLLQGFVLGTALAAWARPGAARAPLALLALLGTGALFAYFGQTYQTGADAWQLFAWWAALTLPLALAVRHDIVWAPWSLVAMTAVALWMQTHTAHRWRFEPQDLQAQLVGWIAAVLIVAGLSAPLRRWSGAGLWSLRSAVVLAAFIVSGTAIGGLLHGSVGAQYPAGLAVIAAGLALLGSRRAFDIFALSALTLALDGLLIAGLVRLLFAGSGGADPIGRMLLVGLVAAALLAFSVSQVLKLARRRREEGLA